LLDVTFSVFGPWRVATSLVGGLSDSLHNLFMKIFICKISVTSYKTIKQLEPAPAISIPRTCPLLSLCTGASIEKNDVLSLPLLKHIGEFSAKTVNSN
jgi:hypothetical protein